MYLKAAIGAVLVTSIARFSSRKETVVEKHNKMYSPEMLVKLLQEKHISQQPVFVHAEIAGIGCEVFYNPRDYTVAVEAPLPVMTDDMEPQEPIFKKYIRQQSFSMTFYKIVNDIAVAIDKDWREYDELINKEVREMIIASKNEEA
jgi:hypothetical protein